MSIATETLISPELMNRYGKLIYDVTGIRISPQKQALLANRVRRRLKATGIADFDAYLKHLQLLKPSHCEWDCFLQEITTHETYLFRDEPHWQWFKDQYLATISQDALAGGRPRSLRIWSAACSTGDEAYSAAICIASGLKQLLPWTVKIIGTDIGVGAVEQARKATFSERAMKLVPPTLRTRYFTNAEPKNESERAAQKLKKYVYGQTERTTLMSPDQTADLPTLSPFEAARRLAGELPVTVRIAPDGVVRTEPAEVQLNNLQEVAIITFNQG